MAINIKFDLVGNPEPPTIILANRNGNKLGQLDVDAKSIELADKLNDASEFTFTLHKFVNGKLTNLWDKVVNFKLVYCKEWDTWFEISVELDEATETIKTVLCTQLGQAELSQIMLYNIEINTEEDIERDDYKISILYDANDPEASILNRVIKDKAPHYSIAYVSPTIAKIQRSFSFNDTSILDAFKKIAEEIGCLFQYRIGLDENGILQRKIAIYDLQQYCNDCGHRGEFTDKCPKCNSTNITNGYGEDTLIFVTSDELASKGIQLTTDTDSVKNCFKLEAGDDLMTATVRSCNPNGTDYIWHFSDDIKEDMSDELVKKLESYNEMYKGYYGEHVSNLDETLLKDYNSLVEKYSDYNEDLQFITTPVVGYSNLMNAYYNTIDLALYLKSGLMPSVEISETNAEEQASLLTEYSLSPVAVADINVVSLATANNAVLSMAKVVVKSTYKVEIKTSELYNSGNIKYWKGKFVVTNYSDEEDIAESNEVSVKLSDDLEITAKQKIEKALNKENTDDLSITGLFEKEYNDFCAELKKYALNPLASFHDACQACIDILIEQGIGNGDSWSDDEEGSNGNLYEKLYTPYYNKLKAIEAEMKIREDEVNIVSGVYDNDGNLISNGLKTDIEECINKIQDALNFEDYLGSKLWLEFCTYRREDKYSNDNYISDGLNNAELFKRALEFFEVAENEIYKSAELQHSISTTLNNLFAIEKFKNLVKSFNVGNWIRVQIDGRIYKLRLIEYSIDFGDFNNISVEFSDVTKVKNSITDVESVLSQASSMATSYSSIQRQANQGDKAKNTIEQWISDGLNSALVQIQSNDSEDITLTKNGLLCRSYDDITGTYSPEQLKLTHNIMAYTDDDWKTVKQAIGKHDYMTYNPSLDNWTLLTGYGMSSEFVTAGQITGSKIVGGEIYSSNYHKGVIGSETNAPKGTFINLATGDFELGSGKIVYNSNNNTVTLDGVVIRWDSINSPTVTDVEGLSELVDSKSTIYTSAPISQRKGDLLVPTSTFKATSGSVEYTFIEKKIYRCTRDTSSFEPAYWTEVNYTDDTKANSAYTLADSAKSVADNAKIIGDRLVKGLGFKETEITGSYVISPVIAGGTLLIGDKSGTYAQIATDGTLTCTNANISGNITANSLTLGNSVSISSSKISGLSSVATSGKYSDLTGKPTIPSSVEDLGLNTSNIIFKGDITQVTKTDSNGISYVETSVPSSSGTIKYSTYNANDYIVFGRSKGTNSSGNNYICVSKDGLLTARNALIYGTVYATNGEFTGSITGSTISGSTFASTNRFNDGIVINEYSQKFYRDGWQVGSLYIGDGILSLAASDDFDMWVYADRHVFLGTSFDYISGVDVYNTKPSIFIGNSGKNTYINGNIYINGTDLKSYIKSVIASS